MLYILYNRMENVMNAQDIIKDISNYKSNNNFIEWMQIINDLSKEEVLKLNSYNYLHGYCEDFGLYFAIRYGVDLLFLNKEHNLVKINNLYFDGANVKGVQYLKDLDYVKESSKLNKLSEKELIDLLKVDEDWKTYDVLARNIHLIENKYKQKI